MSKIIPALFITLGLVSGPAAVVRADSLRLPEVVQFNRDIRPILSNNCFQCHGPDEKHRKADLRLDRKESALADHGGITPFQPHDLEESEAWQRITADDPLMRMPPPDSKKKLTEREVALIRTWIEQGAEWQGHWAFVSPTRPPVPKVKNSRWVRNPIDAFILARMEQEELSPSPEAEREILIRRLTFDLTGLPPTLEEIDAFVNDRSPNAYEKVVDRLLASEAYGERMALTWMDAARYGDTSVFHADGPRDMWPWRNWIIRAYNTNMPFDQFTIEQLAGDLIPQATVRQKIASAFNRNHGTTDEGGAIPEEYRVEYVVDRVKTTSTVWLGLTMECSQCHDHKYDPISQKEYYQFFAFFNQTTDAGMQTRNGNAAPLIDVPNFAARPEIEKLKKQVAGQEQQLQEYVATIEPAFQAWQQEQSAEGQEIESPGDLVAHYPLDEKEGQTASDRIETDRKGTIHGQPQWNEGHVAGALKLDGQTYVDLGDIGDFERTDAFSYGGWIYLDNDSSGAPIARMDDRADYRGYDLYLQDRRFAVHIIHKWPDNAIKVVTKEQFEPERWHHVFVTYDGSSKAAGIKVFVDGQEQEWTIEQDGLRDTIRTSKPLYLGRRNPGSPFKGMLDDIRVYARQLTAAEVGVVAASDPITPILALAPEERTPEQIDTLRTYYLSQHDERYQTVNGRLQKVKSELIELTKPVSTVMIMQEMENPRKTYVLERGHYASPNKDEIILPGTPAVLPPMPEDAPRNRLGLAQWLTDPNHPLTARVAVNRYWQMLFGTGIVNTPGDFGSQGEWPTHPALLDWLAVDFVESGWNVKRMLKQIVMSSTYRQTSRITPEQYRRDPQNRRLARGPRFRLQGEFIRDNALAVSGLLVRQVGGPGVKPYQPPGLWNEVSLSGNVRFVQDHGNKLYRRSMYTYWKRSAPAPSLLIFDTPTREQCVVKRARTNTPLQALVTLNDTQFVEAARALAERMLREGGVTAEDRITFAYRLATSQHPKPGILRILLDNYHKELETFRKDEARAKQLLSVGESPRDESLDPAEHAAWTIIASMILNLDATLIRG